MWIVLKKKFKREGSLRVGRRNKGKYEICIDRVVNTLDDVESGELFSKVNIKK